MKANEFRLGNYVFSNMVEDTIQLSALLESQDLQIKPIPLTEEWLFKFGYDWISENHFANLGHLIWKVEDRFYCDKNGVFLKYVHQLQNLYFALTNEELTIKQ